MTRWTLLAGIVLSALGIASAQAGDQAPARPVLVRTLPNGLTVVVQETRTAPVVAVRAYVKYTGRIWEAPYIGCGISHNLEHLVAGGTTAKRTEDEAVALLKSAGGYSNAYTQMNHTCYFINTAAACYDEALDLLSDWLMNCALDPKEVERERETITEEIGRADDNWMRAAHENFYRALFPGHPVSVPTLGFLDGFRSVTRDDLMAFYRERYIPQNVVFVVVGDVNAEEACAKAAEAFGPWPRGREKTYVLPPTPPPAAPKWVEDTHPAAQTCLAYVGFPSVALTHPDLYALDVLALVLGYGRSSRVTSRVVEREKLAAQAGVYNLTPSYGCGVMTAYLLGLPEGAVRPGVEAILEEMDRCKTELVSEEELKRARTQCIAAHVFNRQTAEDVAEDLGSNVLGVDDPRFSERYIEGIRKVEAEALRDVARRYLDRNRVVVSVLKPPGRPGAAAAATTEKADEGEMVKMTLANGLRVLVQRNTANPFVTLQAWCRAGLGAEPEGKNGLNNLTASLLTHGTATRSRMEIMNTLESLGGKIEASGGNNTFGVKMDVLSEGLDDAFALFADILKNPSFPEKEMDKARFQVLQQIMRNRADAEEEVVRMYRSRFFQAHPYGKLEEGTPAEIQTMTRDDAAAYHRRWFVPGNVVVAVAGDLTLERAKALVEAHFADMAQPEEFQPVTVPQEAERAEAVAVDVESDFKNVLLVVGFGAPRMEDDDRFAMSLMNAIVSAGSGNWVYEALRGKEEGLVYSAWGSFWPGLGASTYYVCAQTAPDKADRVLALIHEQIERARGGVSAEELKNAKRAFAVGEMLGRQTLSGQAQWAALCELYGMGYEFPKGYLERIEKVTVDDVRRVAERYLKNPFVLRVVPKKAGGDDGSGNEEGK